MNRSQKAFAFGARTGVFNTLVPTPRATRSNFRSRWLSDEYFKALKTGCDIEKRQLESCSTLLVALGVFVPIAWGLLRLRALSRTAPDTPANRVLTPTQLDLLRRHPKAKMSSTASVREALLAVAPSSPIDSGTPAFGRDTFRVMGRLGLALLGILALGCTTPPQVQIAPMVSEARANQLSAIAHYKDERLEVTGVVVVAGVRNVDRFVGSPGYGSWTVSRENVQHPYLELSDPADATGTARLVCYFQPSMLEEIAPYTAGRAVTVVGKFQEFTPGSMSVVLNSCRLRDGESAH